MSQKSINYCLRFPFDPTKFVRTRKDVIENGKRITLEDIGQGFERVLKINSKGKLYSYKRINHEARKEAEKKLFKPKMDIMEL